jgi:hypothetical protein
MQILSFWGEAVPYAVMIFILGSLFSLAYAKDVELWARNVINLYSSL